MEQPTYAQRSTLMHSAYGWPHMARELGAQDVQIGDFGPGSRVLTARAGGTHFVVPQGTEDPQAWWRNFKFRRRKVYGATLQGSQGSGQPLGKAHRGMVESYQLMAEWILESARGAETVETLGHSAGGPLAGLAALALAEAGHEVTHVTSCGEHRWANRRLGQLLRQHPRIGKVVRIVDDKDPVTLLPFVGSVTGRYQHVTGQDGVEDGAVVLFLDRDGMPHVDPSRWKKLKSRFRAGGVEPTVDDIGAVPNSAVEALKRKGMERIDTLVGMAAGAIATAIGVPLPLANLIRRQARELSLGAWTVGIFDEAIQDHYITSYEAVLGEASEEVERVLR